MPIEVMAERGRETLSFGPMKPVGLVNPHTGRLPYAVLQLRQENSEATLYNLVGFQTRMKWGEQKRVFSKIPGLEQAVFARFGSLHRNTFITAPALLKPTLQLKSDPRIFFAGQITGRGRLCGVNRHGLVGRSSSGLQPAGQTRAFPCPCNHDQRLDRAPC